MREIKMFGGVFAPPLSDETLARYRGIVNAMPKSEQRDAIDEILRCVEAWWGLPESDPSRTEPHPVGPTMVLNGREVVAPRVVKLEDSIAAALDEHLPWETQAEAITAVLSSIEAEAASANSAKLEAWRSQVFATMLEAACLPVDLRSVECQLLSAALAGIARFGSTATPYVERLVEVFLPGKTVADIEESKKRFVEIREQARVACDSRTASIPEPALESTEVRDMAHHLNWFVRELLAGREPVTHDKLVV